MNFISVTCYIAAATQQMMEHQQGICKLGYTQLGCLHEVGHLIDGHEGQKG